MAKKTVALVGSETLLGREVRDFIRGADLPVEVVAIAAEEGDTRIVAALDSEAVVLVDLQSPQMADAAIVVLCGPEKSSHRALELLRKAGSEAQIVDATGALEDEPAALLRAPLAIPETIERTAGAIDVIAQPAAIALAMFFARLSEAGRVVRSVVTVFEPASERGQRGIGELQQQTVGLLSLKPLTKDVYDAQVSFNMLAAWGEDAPGSLHEIEERVERNLATLLGRGTHVLLPSLRLIQAPVFHGYSISVWAEFENAPDPDAISTRLASSGVDVRPSDLDPPSNVGMAGQGGIAVGAIAVDRNNPRAAWFWLVADNLRIVAENCAEVIRELAS